MDQKTITTKERLAIPRQQMPAQDAEKRRGNFEEVNLGLEILRFQIRLAKDLRCLPLKSYGQAAEQITEIGRQVGGWHRQSKE